MIMADCQFFPVSGRRPNLAVEDLIFIFVKIISGRRPDSTAEDDRRP